MIVCDVDRLKRINDSCGHQTGDHAICMTAHYMQEVFAKNALCCRTGGDEFTCVLEGCAPAETKLFYERFLAAVAEADADLPFKYVDDLLPVCREGGASEASIITSEDKREE